jgi:TIR domain
MIATIWRRRGAEGRADDRGGPMTQYERDFFITYSGRDEGRATWIAAALEASGYTTTIQAWDFRPGDNFMAEMDHALGTCRHTLGVLSADYLTSVFARAEWTAAYRQTLLGKPRGFIPVRVAECDVAPLLGPVSYIDLVGVEEAEALDRLLAGVAARVDCGRGGAREA